MTPLSLDPKKFSPVKTSAVPSQTVGAAAPAVGSPSTPTRNIAVSRNSHYEPKGKETYCNYFTQDVLKRRGVATKDFPSLTANETNQWLHQHGASHGWTQVSGADAQKWVNGGGVGIVNRFNPSGHGHIAPIVEGTATNGVPMISNAGTKNFLVGPATQSPAFRKAGTEYWIYRP